MNTLKKKLTSGISSLLIRRENGSEHVTTDDAAGEEAAESASERQVIGQESQAKSSAPASEASEFGSVELF